MTTYLFLDTNSLYLATRAMESKKLNYDALMTRLAEEGFIPGPDGRFAYGVQVNNGSATFVKYLEHSGFQAYFKNAKVEPGDRREALHIQTSDMTVKMVTDMIANINNYDVLVIATANPTIHTALAYIKTAGKKIVLCLVQENKWLESLADVIINMDDEFFETDETYQSRKRTPAA